MRNILSEKEREAAAVGLAQFLFLTWTFSFTSIPESVRVWKFVRPCSRGDRSVSPLKKVMPTPSFRPVLSVTAEKRPTLASAVSRRTQRKVTFCKSQLPFPQRESVIFEPVRDKSTQAKSSAADGVRFNKKCSRRNSFFLPGRGGRKKPRGWVRARHQEDGNLSR